MCLLPLCPMKHAEECGYKEKCGYRGEEQAADNGSSQGSVLLTAIPEPKRHWNHANDHGQGGHQYRTKTGEARLQCGRNWVIALRNLLRGEADDQNTVRRGHAHAHDCSHERRDA